VKEKCLILPELPFGSPESIHHGRIACRLVTRAQRNVHASPATREASALGRSAKAMMTAFAPRIGKRRRRCSAGDAGVRAHGVDLLARSTLARDRLRIRHGSRIMDATSDERA